MADSFAASSLPSVVVTGAQVFPQGGEPTQVIFSMDAWDQPITYFIGRNGSGKSRTARVVATALDGRLLSTDRLAGLMAFTNYGWTSVPQQETYRGVPLGIQERAQARGFAQAAGSAIDDMYALKEQPEVWLRVAAFLRRSLNRVIELRETAGFLDPYVRVGSIEYSLLRDEGHGLRELVTLLTAVYRRDWQLLVVDEPELHLHPAMVRLWIGELERECQSPDRRAVVVTHEPDILRPRVAADLRAIWLFTQGRAASTIGSHILDIQMDRVTASMHYNPQLLGQLVFSPRPVLVEGVDDVAALTAALSRTQPPEVVAQTDLVACGGSGGVALWHEISTKVGLDVRAVADLDACFSAEVQRTMDSLPQVVAGYRTELSVEPPKTSAVLNPLYQPMRTAGVPTDSKARSKWLASDVPPETGWATRRDKLLAIWRGAGLWLHPQGTLEDVLNIQVKGRDTAQAAAQSEGPIDDVAKWCAYELNATGDVEALLNVAVERIAHGIMEALRIDPGAQFTAPVGGVDSSDSRLVAVDPLAQGRHRLTVKEPIEFRGYCLEFSRDTPSNQLVLRAPEGERASS